MFGWPAGRQLLDRLVGGAVLAQADRVVRVDVHHRDPHQRREPHRGLHVVEEVEERRAEGAEPVQDEAVHDRAHGVLAHAVVHVAAAVVAALHRAAVLDLGERGGLQVGRAATRLGTLLAAHWITWLEALRVAILRRPGRTSARPRPSRPAGGGRS